MIVGQTAGAKDFWKAQQADKEIAWLKMRLELVEYNNKEYGQICENHMQTIEWLRFLLKEVNNERVD